MGLQINSKRQQWVYYVNPTQGIESSAVFVVSSSTWHPRLGPFFQERRPSTDTNQVGIDPLQVGIPKESTEVVAAIHSFNKKIIRNEMSGFLRHHISNYTKTFPSSLWK